MTAVQRGDVCIIAYSGKAIPIGNTGEVKLGDHAFMISQPGELNDNTTTVHLTFGGLEFLPYSDHGTDTGKVTIFRCGTAGLGTKACNHAVTWANKSGSRPGHYSSSRSSGVGHDLKKLGELPYEFDALRRSIKWARKHDKEFSNNKGLTCAAYIVACYQGGAFAGLGFDKLEKAWLKLEELRQPKQEFQQRQKTAHPVNYREMANPGTRALGSETAVDPITQVLQALDPHIRDTDYFLKELLTPGMMTDARFIHSDGLLRRLAKENSGWIKVHEQLPKPVVAQPQVQPQAAPTTFTNPLAGNRVTPMGVNPLYTGGQARRAANNPAPQTSRDDLFGDVKLDSW